MGCVSRPDKLPQATLGSGWWMSKPGPLGSDPGVDGAGLLQALEGRQLLAPSSPGEPVLRASTLSSAPFPRAENLYDFTGSDWKTGTTPPTTRPATWQPHCPFCHMAQNIPGAWRLGRGHPGVTAYSAKALPCQKSWELFGTGSHFLIPPSMGGGVEPHSNAHSQLPERTAWPCGPTPAQDVPENLSPGAS